MQLSSRVHAFRVGCCRLHALYFAYPILSWYLLEMSLLSSFWLMDYWLTGSFSFFSLPFFLFFLSRHPRTQALSHLLSFIRSLFLLFSHQFWLFIFVLSTHTPYCFSFHFSFLWPFLMSLSRILFVRIGIALFLCNLLCFCFLQIDIVIHRLLATAIGAVPLPASMHNRSAMRELVTSRIRTRRGELIPRVVFSVAVSVHGYVLPVSVGVRFSPASFFRVIELVLSFPLLLFLSLYVSSPFLWLALKAFFPPHCLISRPFFTEQGHSSGNRCLTVFLVDSHSHVSFIIIVHPPAPLSHLFLLFSSVLIFFFYSPFACARNQLSSSYGSFVGSCIHQPACAALLWFVESSQSWSHWICHYHSCVSKWPAGLCTSVCGKGRREEQSIQDRVTSQDKNKRTR